MWFTLYPEPQDKKQTNKKSPRFILRKKQTVYLNVKSVYGNDLEDNFKGLYLLSHIQYFV